MTKTQNEKESAPQASNAKQKRRPDIESLPKIEMYAVLGLELGKQILERIEAVEDSLEILAQQKARELKTDHPEVNMTS